MILTNDFSLLKKNQVKKNLFYGSQVRKQGLTNNDALLMRAHSDRQATPGVISFTICKTLEIASGNTRQLLYF